MSKTAKMVAVAVLTMGLPAFAVSNGESPMKEEKPGLAAQAKVTPEAARKTALARVPGRIQSQELEQEHGKLVYSFDIKAPHHSGIEEVQVDALTGKVVSVQHEHPKAEAREKQTDENSEAGSPK